MVRKQIRVIGTHLDHIVIGAATIEQGVDYIQELLGVRVPQGGEHPRMGTCNHLMKLGPDIFFEIIAVNPAAPAPLRPRWYALDDPFVQIALRKKPQLLTWVVSTSDIISLKARSLVHLGVIEPMSRGSLEWMITIPEDGSLPGAGLLPTLIEWHSDVHPASYMPNLGCSLLGLEIFHPYVDWVKNVLSAIYAFQHVKLYTLPTNSTPYLVAHIQTPSGVRELNSKADY